MEKFAGYGFNKSHSTGYAIIAYQTAYLKTYFPIQYMAALLTYESVSTEKVVEYIDECKQVRLPDGRRGIEVRPPDINLSDVAFTVVASGVSIIIGVPDSVGVSITDGTFELVVTELVALPVRSLFQNDHIEAIGRQFLGDDAAG